jgi:FkbH-like protein
LNYVDFNNSLQIKPSMLQMLNYLENTAGEKYDQSTSKKIGVFANFTIDPIEIPLQYFLKTSGISDEVTFGNFDDIAGNLKAHSKDSLAFYIFSLESIATNFPSKILNHGTDWLAELIDSRMNELKLGLAEFSGTLIFGWFSNPELYPDYRKENQAKLINHLRRELDTLADIHSNFQVLDLQNSILNQKTKRVFRLEKYFGDSSILDLQGLVTISQSIVKNILLRREPLIKVICLDADNTLWGGVLGEVGANGIGVSTVSSQDSIFFEAQTLFKKVKERGVILCLITKNELSDIKNVFNQNKNMVLKEDDFAVIVANWAPKSQSIAKIAEDLDLSLDSFYFVDDSPVEILDVGETHPSVRTVQVELNHAKYLLDLYALFQVIENQSSINAEDRTQLYKQRAAVKQLENSSLSRDSFLSSLNTKVRIFKDHREQIGRISELTQRTNQFNFSLKRYTRDEISDFFNDDSTSIWVGEVFDRFGSHGQSVCAIAHTVGPTVVIDTFLASCRILGREIEVEFLIGLCEEFSKHGLTRVEITYTPGLRNAQILDYLEKIKERLECSVQGSTLAVTLPIKDQNKKNYVELEFVYEH